MPGIDYTHQHLSSSIMRDGDPNTPISPSGGGAISSATVTLTDDDILHLPTLGFEIVPAPGEGRMLLFLIGFARSNIAGGNYDNIIGAEPFLRVVYGSGARASDSLYASIILTDQSNTTPVAVFATSHDLDTDGSVPSPSFFSTSLLPSADGTDTSYVNRSLKLLGTNQDGSGPEDYTAGDPENTLTITVWYIDAEV